ncbi:uncharacterized protein [Malus domestica]|uniref:uncharacterized protein n=1 Tax=Malus domestica TaxID=3750 RepID=UPI0004991D4E|nr:uncharacterized protein LOC103454773 [Malus domestica]
METVENAERCIKYLDRSVLQGRLVTVEKAKRKRGRTPNPGRYQGLRDKRGGLLCYFMPGPLDLNNLHFGCTIEFAIANFWIRAYYNALFEWIHISCEPWLTKMQDVIVIMTLDDSEVIHLVGFKTEILIPGTAEEHHALDTV